MLRPQNATMKADAVQLNDSTTHMRHSKIPVIRFTPDVLPNAINVGRGRKIEKPKVDAYKSTPRSSRNIEAYQPIAARSFLPYPIKKKHFSSTHIIQCNFTTIQWSTEQAASTKNIPAASAIPIPTRSCHYIFRGSDNDKSAVSTRKNEMLNKSSINQNKNAASVEKCLKSRMEPLQRFKRSFKKLSSNLRQESRLEQHREMFKSRCARYKANDALRGVRLNRRFDLQMKYREDLEDQVQLNDVTQQ